MFLNTLDDARIKLLASLTTLEDLADFYLAGGTALSLQLGLRKSLDFDFFAPQALDPYSLYGELKSHYDPVEAVRLEHNTCDVLIHRVKVSFFSYPYPLIDPLVSGAAPLEKLRMAGVSDISAMKLAAIGSRGARKDFYDLYQVFQLIPGFTAERLLQCAHTKFGRDFDITYMILGLSYFTDAEDEPLPTEYRKANWQDVKRFFTDLQRRMFDLENTRVRREMNRLPED